MYKTYCITVLPSTTVSIFTENWLGRSGRLLNQGESVVSGKVPDFEKQISEIEIVGKLFDR